MPAVGEAADASGRDGRQGRSRQGAAARAGRGPRQGRRAIPASASSASEEALIDARLLAGRARGALRRLEASTASTSRPARSRSAPEAAREIVEADEPTQLRGRLCTGSARSPTQGRTARERSRRDRRHRDRGPERPGQDRNGPWVSERLGELGVEVAHIDCRRRSSRGPSRGARVPSRLRARPDRHHRRARTDGRRPDRRGRRRLRRASR